MGALPWHRCSSDCFTHSSWGVTGTQTCWAGGGLQLLPWHGVSVGFPALSLLLFILSEPAANAIKPKKNAN